MSETLSTAIGAGVEEMQCACHKGKWNLSVIFFNPGRKPQLLESEVYDTRAEAEANADRLMAIAEEKLTATMKASGFGLKSSTTERRDFTVQDIQKAMNNSDQNLH